MHGVIGGKLEKIDRPSGLETDHLVAPVLNNVAAALWPVSTAANLASHVGCSVRTVERYLEGSRDWSGDAIAAIVAEILARHKMRNVKIRARS